MDSKADKPCRLPVLTIDRTAANKSRPQSERKPFVTFRKITLQRSACSLLLIALDPKLAAAYTRRGVLKVDKLNDPQGALADYDRAIALDSKGSIAYYNRGNLKEDKLNDPQGALADYDRAIALDPKYVNAYTRL